MDVKGLRLYRHLLRLLPRAFREEFGEEMSRVVEEHWRAVRGDAGSWRAFRFWLRQYAGVVRSAWSVRSGWGTVRRRSRGRGRDPAAARAGGVHGGGPAAALLDDLRAATRALGRAPLFSATCVLLLAAGIGANTAVYSVVSGVLLRPLPFADAERLVVVREVPDQAFPERIAAWAGSSGEVHVSRETLRVWREAQRLVELVPYSPGEATLGGETPAVVRRATVSADFFPFLGERLLLGRPPVADEGLPGASPTAVLGHALWRSRFGGDAGVLGSTLTLVGTHADETQELTIIGVARPGFDFPEGAQLWITSVPGAAGDPRVSIRTKAQPVLGRLAPGVALERAEAELSAIASSIPENSGWVARLVPLQDQVAARLRPALLILMAAVSLVLLIGCANVGGLLLARGATRREELAVRSALGASRGRIARGLLLEGLLLGCGAGALGVLLAVAGREALVRLSPAELPRFAVPAVDLAVLAFAVLISVATGLLAGAAPALQSAADLSPALRGGRRHAPGGGGLSRSALVVAEVALSVVLLAGAGVLLRSFLAALAVDPGFRPEQVTAFEIRTTGTLYADNDLRWLFPEELARRVEALPGVVAAGTTRHLPMTGRGEPNPVRIEGRELDAEAPAPQTTTVSPGYFRAMGIPLLAGRDFDPGHATAATVIVNEAFAGAFFPGEDPLGKRVGRAFGGPTLFEIIGVAGDTRQSGLIEPTAPMLYLPTALDLSAVFHLVVRSPLPAETLVPAVRAAAREVDAGLLIPVVTPLHAVVARSVARPRFHALSVGIFAAVAVALALFGLYAVLSHSVAQRKGEVAVRLVLGAAPAEVTGLFLAQGLRIALVGLALGLAAAFAATRLLASLLFGVHPADPVTFAAVAGLLLGAAALATLLPARRAARIDPARSLQG